MIVDENKWIPMADDVWMISEGRYTNLDLYGIDESIQKGIGKEYRISDLARYMLNPNPIEVKKTLIGCEIHARLSSFDKLKEKLKGIVPKKFQRTPKNKNTPPRVLLSGFIGRKVYLKDENLESHLRKIYELLSPYDPVLKELSKVNVSEIADIVGICEDIDGNHSSLTLRGTIEEKLNFVRGAMSKNVGVILEKAHVSEGLFEMRGFDFTSYDPKRSHRLLKISLDGPTRYCVLDSNNKVEYWVENTKLVHYVHLMEQLLRTDPKFYDSLKQCTEGNAIPLKLLFYRHLAIDYSESHLPKAYREVFKNTEIGMNGIDLLMNSLKCSQLGVSINYLPQSFSGNEKMCVNISVMHDFRALEPIRNNLPLLYSEINKRTYVSEAGKFYLLDSIRGVTK